MDRYTIYCNEAQTKKALELGAPIEYQLRGMFKTPTAEQMLGWLEEQINDINVGKKEDGTWFYMFYPNNTFFYHFEEGFHSRAEATLAAIDAALEYLSTNKK